MATLADIRARIDATIAGSRTASLWLKYNDMFSTLRQFVCAERTRDWNLHLESAAAMLPFLAASGHNSYTKSLYIYIQKIRYLPQTNPVVHEQFLKRLHVIRRSDRFWAGHSTDLVIEQISMLSVKSRVGLTRGRG
jgi:hypothetical protein